MKSKSFDLKKTPTERGKHNKSFDFVGLYKSAAETNAKLLENPKTQNFEKENNFSNSGEGRSDQSHIKKKKGRNELIDISHITIDGHNLSSTGRSSPVRDRRATSTPNVSRKAAGLEPKVKSIMKTSQQPTDDAMDGSVTDTPVVKPKKRNKSVSFMLDDTDEIVVKKTKSDDSIQTKKTGNENSSKQDKKKQKKLQKSVFQREDTTVSNGELNLTKKMRTKVFKKSVSEPTDTTSDVQTAVVERKKKLKKLKKRKTADENSEPTENDSNNNEEAEARPKKFKKKKLIKPVSTETSEEAPAKKVKKEVKPEVIAEDLENLSIGDNAHTLTNLLDEMTVVDKDKKKRNKLRRKKSKEPTTASVSSSETQDLEKIEEGKEKVKWKKRKWNKDKKGDVDEDVMANTVIIDNLPLKIMCSYKKLLLEHFNRCGLIKRVGIAEVYPTEDPKPVFTTTIVFCSEAAATKALEEDNTLFEGSRIRVKRPLPPTQTTIVVRSYAELTDQNLSSVFTSAGRIRSIRQLVKGKKAMATAFIEFDGPETVERATKMAEDAKIGGKKIHVSKFEMRASKRKVRKTQPDSENEGDSEDSND